MNVVIRISRLKKAIESFTSESYLLLVAHAPDVDVAYGELRHKDLQGHVVSSQLFDAPDDEDEDDEEESEDSEEEAEE